MSKSQRLLELMMTVNRKRRFTVRELAEEFGVSPRTMLRDLQELSGMGVPLYSETGRHGGYRVLNERVLPPIAFTEEEAVAMFFAVHALRHYDSLPFETESASALHKFYLHMPGDTRDRIDQMRHRVDFVTPGRQAKAAFLPQLLDAAVRQKVLRIGYASRSEVTERDIQPVGLFASSGLWYCPAYCFSRAGFRLFRCDRIQSACPSPGTREALDLSEMHLGNWSHDASAASSLTPITDLAVELSREGVQRCEAELWTASYLHIREDGTGLLEGRIPSDDIPFVASFCINLGQEASVERPPELIGIIRQKLAELLEKYR